MIEELHPRRAPGRLGKQSRRPLREGLPGEVDEVAVVTLHVRKVDLRVTVPVKIRERRVAKPPAATQSHPRRHLLEPTAAQVPVEKARLGSLWNQMALERVHQRPMKAPGPKRVRRVDTNVGHQKIQKTVPVEIQKHGTRRMPHIPQSRGGRRILKTSPSLVQKQAVTVPDGGHEKIGIPVVVDIAEGRRHRDLIDHPHSGLLRDVLEPAPAQIAPKFVGTQVGAEIEVEPPVAVDVRHGEAAPVVVVGRLVVAPRVVHRPVLETNPAGVRPVRESESAIRAVPLDRRLLDLSSHLQLALRVAMLGTLGRHRRGRDCQRDRGQEHRRQPPGPAGAAQPMTLPTQSRDMGARDRRPRGRSYGAWILYGPIVAMDRPPLTGLCGIRSGMILGITRNVHASAPR